MMDREIRLRRIRNRLLGQSALGVICNLLAWFSLSSAQGFSLLITGYGMLDCFYCSFLFQA